MVAICPRSTFQEIYNTIRDDEIKLLSEQHAALLCSGGRRDTESGFAGVSSSPLATVGHNTSARGVHAGLSTNVLRNGIGQVTCIQV